MKKTALTILVAVELLFIGWLGVAVIARVLPRQSSPVILNVSEGSNTLDSSQAQNDKSATLLFAGDIMLDRSVKKRIQTEQDPLYPFLLIASTTRAADLTIANLEGPISERGVRVGSIYSFRFEPAGTVNALNFAGFDIMNLANNHIWDYGALAAADTMRHLTEAGVAYTGFGKNSAEANAPVIKKIDDTKVAFLGYTEFYSQKLWADDRLGLSAYEPDALAGTIAAIKSSGQADVVVVSLHWGTEYETQSRPWQQELAHRLIDAGADIIIGHHPHVVQEVEQYQNGWVAYSLGNFIFDQNFSEATMRGLLLEATIQNKKIVDVKEIPIKLSPTFQPYVVSGSSL